MRVKEFNDRRSSLRIKANLERLQTEALFLCREKPPFISYLTYLNFCAK